MQHTTWLCLRESMLYTPRQSHPMSLPLILGLVLGASLALMVGLHFLYLAKITDSIKIYPDGGKRLTAQRLIRNILPNSIFSGFLTIGMYWVLRVHFIDTEVDPEPLTALGQAVLVIGLYDFLYYCLHRFLFHEWEWMRSVHIVHHTVKFPTAGESLYVHPLENALGVLLLGACVWMVGPLSVLAFAIVLAVHSMLNVVIHSGLSFRHPVLRPIAFIVEKHAKHHTSMRAGNYASITPLPDLIFRTLD